MLSSNSYSAVLINEILANGLSDPEHEWAELYNNGTSDINLTNWKISETLSSNFTLNTTIQSKSFIILAVDFSTFNSTYPNVNQSGIRIINITISNFNLADTSGEVRLYNSSGILVDLMAYVQRSGKTFENISIGRYPDGSSSIFNLSTLTPGAKNDNKAPTLNKWANPSKNNTNISALTNITVNITDDTAQVNTSIINFNGTNFSMAKNGDVWYFLWNTGSNAQKLYNITIFFNDSYGKSNFDSLFNIFVNNSPYIVSFSPPSLTQTITENSTLKFSVNATDPDDTKLDFTWLIDGKLNGTNIANFSYSPDFNANGTHSVNATINDPASNQVSMKWAVIVTNFNRAPILDAIPDKTFSKNINSSFDITANDLDNDALIFSANHSDILISKINNSAAAISWKPTNRDLGKNTINFTVSDGLLIGSKLAIILVNITNNTPPTITSVPKLTATVNEEHTYDVDASDADNDVLNFSIKTNASGMSIDSSRGLIIFTPQSIGFFVVNVSASDFIAITNQSSNITVNPGSKLKIIDLDAKIRNKRVNVDNNTRIRKKAMPGSNVEFKVKIKNDFSDEDDLSIEDTDLRVTIEEMDDGDDLELEAKEFDLGAQDDKKITFKFNVPLDIDEDTFDVLIEAEGEDENGTLHRSHFEVKLEVEKEKHGLRFLGFDLKPPTINCNRIVTITYEVINIGQEDEENIILEIKSNELNFTHTIKNISIESGDEDNTFLDSIKLKIDNNVKKGTYPMTANVYSDDGRLRDTKTSEIKVNDCSKPKITK
ncbi:lamin tail domain-containing protein [Candidatus Woesearchaeota archaeon]|nr:lamin tail domain-containing protein [Candidatus Woesearchaeota archaeon]